MIGFVVGHPRSGTQFLSELLNAGASKRRSGHELLCRLDIRTVAAATRYYLGRIGEPALARFLARYDSQSIGIDCNWKLAWILPPLLRRYPRARLLHLVREPAENVRSCFNLDYFGKLGERGLIQRERYRDYWLKWMPPVRRADWESLDAFARNCAFWDETQRLIEEQATSAAGFLRLRIEELSAPEPIQAIFDFFALRAPRRDEIERVCATRFNTKVPEKQAVAQVRGDVLPAYAEWPLERRAALARICGARAVAFGYSLP